jgi:hypothetical protein
MPSQGPASFKIPTDLRQKLGRLQEDKGDLRLLGHLRQFLTMLVARRLAASYLLVSAVAAGAGVMFQVSIRIFQSSPSRESIVDQ